MITGLCIEVYIASFSSSCGHHCLYAPGLVFLAIAHKRDGYHLDQLLHYVFGMTRGYLKRNDPPTSPCHMGLLPPSCERLTISATLFLIITPVSTVMFSSAGGNHPRGGTKRHP